jgi:hypothetical protein
MASPVQVECPEPLDQARGSLSEVEGSEQSESKGHHVPFDRVECPEPLDQARGSLSKVEGSERRESKGLPPNLQLECSEPLDPARGSMSAVEGPTILSPDRMP